MGCVLILNTPKTNRNISIFNFFNPDQVFYHSVNFRHLKNDLNLFQIQKTERRSL